MKLILERKDEDPISRELGINTAGLLAPGIMMTPTIDADTWSYRVMLTESQAILGFPKFSTIGIGFAEEEDWNSNLPYTIPAEEILDHIRHNKGDDSISDEDVLNAIRLIQSAVIEDRSG